MLFRLCSLCCFRCCSWFCCRCKSLSCTLGCYRCCLMGKRTLKKINNNPKEIPEGGLTLQPPPPPPPLCTRLTFTNNIVTLEELPTHLVYTDSLCPISNVQITKSHMHRPVVRGSMSLYNIKFMSFKYYFYIRNYKFKYYLNYDRKEPA